MGGFDQGFALGSRSSERGVERRQALSDEEREQARTDYTDSIHNIQQKMATPEMQNNPGALNLLHNQLNKVVEARTALFHPDQGPGAMAHLGRMVWEHVHGKPEAQTAQLAAAPAATLPTTAGVTTPELLGDTPEAVLPAMPGGVQLPATAGATVSPRATPAQLKAQAAQMRTVQNLEAGAPAAPVNPYLQTYQQIKAAFPNMPEEDARRAVLISAGAEKPVTATARAGAPLLKLYDVPGGGLKWLDAKKPEELPEGATVHLTSRSAHLSEDEKSRLEYATALGKPPEDLTFEEDLNRKELIKGALAGRTVATHVGFQNINGQVVPIRTETTSGKTFGGVMPTGQRVTVPIPGVPAAPAAATPEGLKRRAAAIAPVAGAAPKTMLGGSVQVGEPIGERPTGPQAKAQAQYLTDYRTANLANTAEQHPTAQNQKQLALAIIKGAAGRVNMQEYDILTQRAGLGNTLEAWANSATTGMLPDQIFRGLIGVTRDNLAASKSELTESQKSIANITTTYKQTASGPGGHKIGTNDGGVTWFDVQTNKQVQ